LEEDAWPAGYLLPTREQIMAGRPQAATLLALAERAEGLGFDSIWVGDSLLARPRHEPLALLAAVAARVRRLELGTAVLLPALRNPVLLAHQVATLDQISEGRLILGVGIAADGPNIRAEFTAAGVPFEKRVGRLLEGLRLCRALWSGKPVDWDGLWKVQGGVLGPTPRRRADRRCGSAGRIRQASTRGQRISTAGCRSRRRHAGLNGGPRCRRPRATPAAMPARLRGPCI
jgi:alkanesulfonate monooxygenase SsuD/methylene tetrahydromethanopterin reductase-like flavin-dependent oxidoreductase (luciferase family)